MKTSSKVILVLSLVVTLAASVIATTAYLYAIKEPKPDAVTVDRFISLIGSLDRIVSILEYQDKRIRELQYELEQIKEREDIKCLTFPNNKFKDM